MQAILDKLIPLLIAASREELLTRFRRVGHTFKTDGSLLTEADLAMQTRLQNELATAWPEYDFMAEEMGSAQQQALLTEPGKGLWCLDPLDGTSNFATGIPHFAPSLALLKDGQVRLGVVYDPIREECFSAIRGQGAWLNGQALSLRDTDYPLEPAIAIIDFKRLTPALATSLVADPPYKSQRSFGSVALDWCWLAAGRGHVYLHGRQNLWDYAAGQLIFEEAGGYSASLEGDAVFRPTLQARSAVAGVSRILFERWLKRVQMTG